MRFLICLLILLANPAQALDLGLTRMLNAQESRDWVAVGRVNFAGISERSMCTGALIEPDLVLTAAHCVIKAGTGVVRAPSNITFVAGWRLGTAVAHRKAAKVVIHPGYMPHDPMHPASIATDLALIRLESAIGAGEVAPFALADRADPRGAVTLVSYRRDRPHALSLQQGCTVTERRGAVVALDCEVTFGVSGAPVFDGEGEGRRITGVISAMGTFAGKPHAFAVSVAAQLPDLMAALGE